MINVITRLMNAWFALLNGNLNVPVYRIDAPETATDYVIIRPESESDNSNNSSFVTAPVIITEVVTRFGSGELIDEVPSFDIDTQISQLLHSDASFHNLPAQQGIQIVSVKRQSSTYLPEDDGSYRYHRVITRNIHQISQL